MTQRGFVEVAEQGLARLDEGENPNLPFDKITDPKRAFQAALKMFAIWVAIRENEDTKFWALRTPMYIDEHTIVLYGIPMEPVRDMLIEAQGFAQRIREKAEITYGEHTIALDVIDITIRVKIYRTEIDVTADSDIDELVAKHDAQSSNPIPVFGGEAPEGVVGSAPVIIR